MKIANSKKLTAIVKANKDLCWDMKSDASWIEGSGCNPFDLFEAGLQMAEQCVKEDKQIYEVVVDDGEYVYFFVGHEDELERECLDFVESEK